LRPHGRPPRDSQLPSDHERGATRPPERSRHALPERARTLRTGRRSRPTCSRYQPVRDATASLTACAASTPRT